MPITIFYSWQSDRPANINRNFIEDALKKAIKGVGRELNIEDAPRDSQIILDKDTKGVPGQPHIADVIFQKISECGIFVPDLTFIGKSEEKERLLMNPNVLIEYGWALNKPSRNRIVSVMNSAFGEPGEDLPFDMRHVRHPLTYKLNEDASPKERNNELDVFTKKLTLAIKTILESGIISEKMESEPFEMIQPTSSPSTFLAEGKAVGLDDYRQPLFMHNGQHLFFRIIPTQQIEKIRSNKAALDLINSGGLKPLDTTRPFNILRNIHGAYVYHSTNGKVLTLTQLFLNKELWGIDAYSIDKQRLIKWSEALKINFGYFPCSLFEDRFLNALVYYLKFAKEFLSLPLPLKIIAGATNVEGYKMATPNQFNRFDGFVHDQNIVWESTIEDYDIEPSKILRPFFDYVWEACGLTRPDVEFLRG